MDGLRVSELFKQRLQQNGAIHGVLCAYTLSRSGSWLMLVVGHRWEASRWFWIVLACCSSSSSSSPSSSPSSSSFFRMMFSDDFF